MMSTRWFAKKADSNLMKVFNNLHLFDCSSENGSGPSACDSLSADNLYQANLKPADKQTQPPVQQLQSSCQPHPQHQQQPPQQEQDQLHHQQQYRASHLVPNKWQWPCPACKIDFKNPSELQAHLSSHIKRKKIVQTDIKHYFGSRDNDHLKAAHREKTFSCGTHTKFKPFICRFCERRFSYKINLQRHLMIHTGERPYPCEICGKRFYRKDKLLNHRKTHTGIEQLKEKKNCHL